MTIWILDNLDLQQRHRPQNKPRHPDEGRGRREQSAGHGTSAHGRRGGGDLNHGPMSIESLIAWKMAALALWLAALFVWERRAPAAPWPAGDGGLVPGWRRLVRNGGLWIVNSALSPLIFVPVAAVAAGLGPDWRGDALWLPGPGWMLLIDLLIL